MDLHFDTRLPKNTTLTFPRHKAPSESLAGFSDSANVSLFAFQEALAVRARLSKYHICMQIASAYYVAAEYSVSISNSMSRRNEVFLPRRLFLASQSSFANCTAHGIDDWGRLSVTSYGDRLISFFGLFLISKFFASLSGPQAWQDSILHIARDGCS